MIIETIPLGVPFIHSLALSLYQENITTPHHLAGQIIIMPTQRACRILEQTFLQIAPHLLLPKILPLADLQDSFLAKLLTCDDLPTINVFERLGLLTQLLKKYKNLTIWQCHQYAIALMELLDDFNIYDIPLDKIKELSTIPDNQHLKEGINFLNILVDHWPQILKDEGKCEPQTVYKNFIKKLCNFFDSKGFNTPITIAGTTGSVPTTQELIASVLKLPQSRLILPGFDKDEKTVPPFHPQWTMQNLLQKLSVDKKEVKYLIPPNQKTTWLRNLMDPEILVDNGINLNKGQINLIQIPSLINEAKTIATIMRYHYEEEDKTIALVTANPNLGNLVQQELSRWNMIANQSLGIPLKNTLVGDFFQRTSHLMPDTLQILSILKHPLADQIQLESAQIYELYLRNQASDNKHNWQLEPSFKKMSSYLQQDQLNIVKFWQELTGTFSSHKFIQSQTYAFKDLLDYHIQITEKLNKDLYTAQGAEKVRDFINDLHKTSNTQPKIKPLEYPIIFKQLLDVAEPFNDIQTNQRLLILGALEARLHNANIVILGDLNEGSWPKVPQEGPWFSPNMRQHIGLPPLEKRIGLSAHDFCNCFCAQKVYITRNLQEGSPPSRFWIRLETMAKLQSLDLTPDKPWQTWVNNLDKNDQTLKPIRPPQPNPKPANRPREFAASHIELLMRDPYGFYLRKCLNLIPLNELINKPSYKERGNAFHKFLEEFFNSPQKTYEVLFNTISKSISDKAVIKFWQPQVINLYKWLCNFYQNNSSRNFITEKKGEIKIDDFTIFARADRIDQINGKTIIIDYKTTTPPTLKDIENGFSPQLVVESLIAQSYGFENLESFSHFEFWHITGRKENCVEIIKHDLELSNAKIGIRKLINHYGLMQNPYLACPIPEKSPNHNNYKHLERIQEWQ